MSHRRLKLHYGTQWFTLVDLRTVTEFLLFPIMFSKGFFPKKVSLCGKKTVLSNSRWCLTCFQVIISSLKLGIVCVHGARYRLPAYLHLLHVTSSIITTLAWPVCVLQGSLGQGRIWRSVFLTFHVFFISLAGLLLLFNGYFFTFNFEFTENRGKLIQLFFKLFSLGNHFEYEPCSFNLFPNKPWFLRVCSTVLLKTLWEKEKLFVTSNFSFSQSVFYPLKNFQPFSSNLKLSSANSLNLEESIFCRLGKG